VRKRPEAQVISTAPVVLEAELTTVLDSMFPMPPVVEALRAFTERFPTVPPRVYVQPLGAAADIP
jgi:hypothetical protein